MQKKIEAGYLSKPPKQVGTVELTITRSAHEFSSSSIDANLKLYSVSGKLESTARPMSFLDAFLSSSKITFPKTVIDGLKILETSNHENDSESSGIPLNTPLPQDTVELDTAFSGSEINSAKLFKNSSLQRVFLHPVQYDPYALMIGQRFIGLANSKHLNLIIEENPQFFSSEAQTCWNDTKEFDVNKFEMDFIAATGSKTKKDWLEELPFDSPTKTEDKWSDSAIQSCLEKSYRSQKISLESILSVAGSDKEFPLNYLQTLSQNYLTILDSWIDPTQESALSNWNTLRLLGTLSSDQWNQAMVGGLPLSQIRTKILGNYVKNRSLKRPDLPHNGANTIFVNLYDAIPEGLPGNGFMHVQIKKSLQLEEDFGKNGFQIFTPNPKDGTFDVQGNLSNNQKFRGGIVMDIDIVCVWPGNVVSRKHVDFFEPTTRFEPFKKLPYEFRNAVE